MTDKTWYIKVFGGRQNIAHESLWLHIEHGAEELLVADRAWHVFLCSIAKASYERCWWVAENGLLELRVMVDRTWPT